MIALHKYEINANILQRYAIIEYLLNFENKHNDKLSKELKFELTIDPDAFISGFTANIDGEIFHGITQKKQKAAKEYIEAKSKHKNAILITKPYRNITNVFQIQTNIDSKSKISLKIKIEQYIKKKFDFNQLNIQILKHFNKYNIIKDYLTPNILFNLLIEDKSGIYDIQIPSSSLKQKTIINKSNTHCSISGKIGYISNINELEIKYKIKGEQTDSIILYDNNSNTFCHIISDIITDSIMNDENHVDEGKKDEIKNNILIPRRVVFVIDGSLSMKGIKWEKTKLSTITALKQLRSGYDRYCVILFDEKIKLLNNKEIMFEAKDENITNSINNLNKYVIGGGTNINDALLKAIDIIKIDIGNNHIQKENKNNSLLDKAMKSIKSLKSNYNDDKCMYDDYNYFINQLIFITDGHANRGVYDTKKILKNVKTANDISNIDKYSSKICIFSFGIGKDSNDSSWINDLNHSFLKLLSLNNNGIYKRIKQTNTDITLNQYFNILSKPILSNISVKYKNKNINNLTTTTFDSLYAGNDLIICGRIEKTKKNKKHLSKLSVSATITAITAKIIKTNKEKTGFITKPIRINKKMKIDIDIDENKDNDYDDNNVERIWAYLKLKQFEEKQLMSNVNKFNDMIPLSLAIKYKFVTPWTSMIVIKHKNKSIETTNNCKEEKEETITKSKESHKKQSESTYPMSNDDTKQKHKILESPKTITYRVKNTIFVLNERYKPRRIIGNGAYSSVCEVIDCQTEQKRAITKKLCIFDCLIDAQILIREIKLLLHMNHEDILDIVDILSPDINEIDTYNDIYLIQNKMETTLARVIRSKQELNDRYFQFFMYQILRALVYIHSANISHNKLSPENILINGADCNVKITGFGQASPVLIGCVSVTRWYDAPENLCNKGCTEQDMEQITKELLVYGYIRKCNISNISIPDDVQRLIAIHFLTFVDTTKCDIWAVGSILAELITRKPFFPGNNFLDQLSIIFEKLGKPKDISWIKLAEAKRWIEKLDDDKFKEKPLKQSLMKFGAKPTEEVVNLLSKMLVINPQDRYSALQCLRDPYFKDLYRESDERLCDPFVLSLEFEKSIKTRFGCRHLLYDIITQIKQKKQIKHEKRKKRRAQ